ncbi:hypothetical protein EDC01DRAFT_746992 [Geopyxis carbonaria]|nr:hypothetical protein EDC01DRAFT_746992 [Geopyxis carbonaria]
MNPTYQAYTSVAAAEAALEAYSELWLVAVDAFHHRKRKASTANREFRARHQAVQKALEEIEHLTGETPVRARTRRQKRHFYKTHWKKRKLGSLIRTAAMAKRDAVRARKNVWKASDELVELRKNITALEKTLMMLVLDHDSSEDDEVQDVLPAEVRLEMLPQDIQLPLSWGIA